MTRFCCLGAPQARGGSLAQLRPVDLELTLAFARTALGLGATRLVVISAAGADRKSPVAFLGVKGELETALRELRFPAIDILSPGAITGVRPQMGPGDWLGLARPLLNPLLRGGLSVRQAFAPADVAAAMIGAARSQRGGVHVHAGATLRSLAESGVRRA